VQVVGGNFKREKNKETGELEVTGWSSAFRVLKLFQNLGIKGSLENDNKIPAEWVEKLKGRKVWRATYVKGLKKDNPEKLAWSSWNTFTDAEGEDGFDKLKKEWEDSRKRGYPQNYKPEAMNEVGTSFGPPLESKEAGETTNDGSNW
jgi:hypothetical protein